MTTWLFWPGCCAGLNMHVLWLPALILGGQTCGAGADKHALTALTCAGVMDSVSKGYLKNMYFGISQDAAGTKLLEVRGSAQHLQLLPCALSRNCPCVHAQLRAHSVTGSTRERHGQRGLLVSCGLLSHCTVLVTESCWLLLFASHVHTHAVLHLSCPACACPALQEYIYTFKYGKDGVEFDMEAAVSGKNKKKYKSTKTVGALAELCASGNCWQTCQSRPLCWQPSTASTACFGPQASCTHVLADCTQAKGGLHTTQHLPAARHSTEPPA